MLRLTTLEKVIYCNQAEVKNSSMSEPKKNNRSIEGYYNYYGVPAYVLKRKNGSFASGYYDWIEGVFKAGGSVKKILWAGVKISFAEAKRLISKYSRTEPPALKTP